MSIDRFLVEISSMLMRIFEGNDCFYMGEAYAEPRRHAREFRSFHCHRAIQPLFLEIAFQANISFSFEHGLWYRSIMYCACITVKDPAHSNASCRTNVHGSRIAPKASTNMDRNGKME
ncbi:hypothetical protein CEXT_51131 [Caerostris extrusa]|uniref:Uncharacterized protein n=1 Tax=Caerostris extrusa TaxID=172846 RepID=A0AAV4N6B2_CAEEX|nr:hypothetical protein CEXT_51131 [Caerostris extrusa]